MGALADFFAPMRMSLVSALVISVCVVDSVTIAYDGSLMGSLNVMDTFIKYFGIDTNNQGITSGATFAGAVFVAPIASKIIDWKGRKLGVIVSALINIFGAALGAGAQNLAMFIASRICIGIAVAIAQTSASSYVSETTAPHVRAFALGLYFTCWSIGSFLATGISRGAIQMEPSDWAWRMPCLLQGVPPILVLVVLCFLPESPRWLAYNDRREEALLALAKVNGESTDSIGVQTQYHEIVDTIDFEKTDGRAMGFREVIRTPANRRRLALAVSVAPLVMLTGSNVITYYFGTMLAQAGIDDSQTQLEINLGLSAFQLVMALSGSLLAEKLGRRKLALISLSFCIIFFYLLGGLTARYGTSTEKSGIYGTVVIIFLFLGSYSFGITPLTAMYAPEVLSYNIRASGLACFAMTNEICGFFVTMVFPFMFDGIGWRTYMVNASWNVLLLAFVYFKWVETKGKTLEEISKLFDGEKHSDVPDLKVVQEQEKAKIDAVESVATV